MKLTRSYQASIYTTNTYVREALAETTEYYTRMVRYYINIINEEWETIAPHKTINEKKTQVERLTHATKVNPAPKHADYDTLYNGTPAYMRRAAIAKALGLVMSHKANHAAWEAADPATRGKEPQLGHPKELPPTFYKDGSYKTDHTQAITTTQLKLRAKGAWRWVRIGIRSADARYIENLRRLPKHEMLAPTLVHNGGTRWSLRFAFEITTSMNPTDWEDARVLAVDLGINTPAVCVVMEPDGTVVARRFIRFAAEEGHIRHLLNDMRRKQSKGARKLRKSWARINNLNGELSRKTAAAIVDMAIEYSCDAIACEYLSMTVKIRGSRKFRLSKWRKREVYRLIVSKAHVWGIHVHQVCAWGTSRLAFDGSGRVQRGKYIVDEGGKSLGLSHSWVRFASGKLYHADLNAALNIAARFFMRGVLKAYREGRLCIRDGITGGSLVVANGLLRVRSSAVTLSALIGVLSVLGKA